ncbi:MAG TPA: Cof-type HAD-IIB family hydrolase [Candidatus Anaerofilum faecale]|nr:Cof-type HAD-IIB family hydrolase [Candidatus Anaerofilum faecale]
MKQSLKDILVVCDIDNTLITDTMELPACNLEMIRLFCTLGGHFTVASGRTPASIRTAVRDVPINAPVIACGGAMLLDTQTDAVLYAKRLNETAATWLLNGVLEHFPEVGAEVMTGSGEIYIVNASPYTEKHIRDESLSCVWCPPGEVPSGWLKVLFAAEPQLLAQVKQYVAQQVFSDIQLVETNRVYYEIMPENVNKGECLRLLCQKMQIPLENTVAIGDYYNDIDLLKTAGRSVAMGNAPWEVKQAADVVTGDCRDGGVASYLYQLIKEYT